MSNVSSLNSYTSAANNNVNSVLNSNLKNKGKDTFNEDKVTLSKEAQELTNELRYKKNLTNVTTLNEVSFDRVSKALPATEGFNEMLSWLSRYEKAVNKSVSMNKEKEEEPDRNVYRKNPKQYSDMWNNMYKHYNETIKGLGLDKDEAQLKEVLSDDSISAQLMYRFQSSFSSETKNMLNYFNITF